MHVHVIIHIIHMQCLIKQRWFKNGDGKYKLTTGLQLFPITTVCVNVVAAHLILDFLSFVGDRESHF